MDEKWTLKKITYKKEPLFVEIKRLANPAFKEYYLKLDNEIIGYISQGEDREYTPYFETYDDKQRLIQSMELYDSVTIDTAIIRIVRERKGHKKVDYRKQFLAKQQSIS